MKFRWALLAFMIVCAIGLGIYAQRSAVGTSVLVEWSTASELDTVGFNLHRSESPDGPYSIINDQLIPASTDPLLGGDYTFEDTNVIPGVIYYYLLEDVEISGAVNKHGPIEIEAEARGKVESLLAIVLVIAALSGMGVLLVPRRNPTET